MPPFSGKAAFEIFIAEPAHQFAGAVRPAQKNVRWTHSVESVVLNHGVDRHIFEHHPAARPERRVEGIVSDHVPGEAGWPRKAV